MNTMSHDGYEATIQFDEQDGCFHGLVVNARDVLHFEGHSVAELHREFKRTVQAYQDACRQFGREPQRPFSGKFQTRIPPELHRSASAAARRRGQSLNAFVQQAITHELEHPPAAD